LAVVGVLANNHSEQDFKQYQIVAYAFNIKDLPSKSKIRVIRVLSVSSVFHYSTHLRSKSKSVLIRQIRCIRVPFPYAYPTLSLLRDYLS
jgi:hypothetical protein